MKFKSIFLTLIFSLSLITTTHLNTFFRSDGYYTSHETAESRSLRQVKIESDYVFALYGKKAVSTVKDEYGSLIEIINTGNLSAITDNIERIICCYYGACLDNYLYNLVRTTNYLWGLLAYQPQDPHNPNLVQIHHDLQIAKDNLEKLANCFIKERIELYKNAYEIIKHSSFDELETLPQIIYAKIKVTPGEISPTSIIRLKQLRDQIQADLDQFLKASKWHTTPKSIENILAALDSLYNDAAKNLVKTNHEI